MSFVDRMKEAIEQGLETTKTVLATAAEKARELGEKGVLKYEIGQLEKQVEKRFALAGGAAYSILVEQGKNTVSKTTPEVKEIFEEITELQEKIEEKEEALAKIGTEDDEEEVKKEPEKTE